MEVAASQFAEVVGRIPVDGRLSVWKRQYSCKLVEILDGPDAGGAFLVDDVDWLAWRDALDSFQTVDQIFNDVSQYQLEDESWFDCQYRLIADGDVEPDGKVYEKFA
jgi:hypothetical protein